MHYAPALMVRRNDVDDPPPYLIHVSKYRREDPAMYDSIIRGGTIVDGLGGDRYSGDIAIKDGRIAEIGSIRAPAREVIDADGAIVTPGFVDVHTHYDGQVLWDSQIDPSFS